MLADGTGIQIAGERFKTKLEGGWCSRKKKEPCAGRIVTPVIISGRKLRKFGRRRFKLPL